MKSVHEFTTKDETNMIIPEYIVCESSGPQAERKISYYVKDGILLERIEVMGSRRVTAFLKNTNVERRSYTTDFDILKALYVTFTPKTPEDYLCLIGVSHIDFYAVADDQYCSLAIPFKIWDAYVCSMGILLERNCFSECNRDGNPPDASQLFSLTHPYNEIFPVLCKFREKSESCQYAFRNRRMCVVPSSEGVSRTSTYSGLVLAYDFNERSSHLFYIRRCTKEERQSAKDELLLSGYGGIFTSVHTPASIRSFYSPNFFDRRFAAVTDQQAQQQMRVSFGGQSNSTFHVQSSSPFTHPSPALAPGTGNRITPLRHSIRTRSMLAAAHNENLAFASSLGGISGSVNSSSANSSLQRAPRSEQKSLLREAITTRLQKNPALKDYTPTRVELDESELLSLGRDDSTTYLDCSVEFCLEWIWSERERWADPTHPSPIPLKAISKLCVSSSSMPANHPGEIGDEDERRPPQCFSTVDVFGQHYFVYNIPSERQMKVLRVKCRGGEFSVLKCCSFPNIIGITPLLHSRFYVTLERSVNDPADTTGMASSPRIVLFSGSLRVGIVSMDSVDQKGVAVQVNSAIVRLRPGGVDSFRCICEAECGSALERGEIKTPPSRQDEAVQRMVGEAMKFFAQLYPTPHPPSCIPTEERTGSVAPSNPLIPVSSEFRFGLKLGMTSRQARAALMAMVDSFRRRQDKEHFITVILEANMWRSANTVMRLACCEQLTLAKVELSLLLDQYIASKSPSQSAELPSPLHRQVLQLREMLESMGGGESTSKKRRGSSDDGGVNDSKFWELLCRDVASQCKSFDEYLASASPFLPSKLLTILGENQAEEAAKMCDLSSLVVLSSKPGIDSRPNSRLKRFREFPQPTDTSRWTTARWTADIRVDNVAQMLDSSLPILIPPVLSKHLTNEAHLREQQEQFLLATSTKTLTRPFGQAIIGFGSKSKSAKRVVRPVCLHGKANPGQMQIEFPATESSSLGHKQLMEWANFYNAVAHGLSTSGLECDFRDLYQQAEQNPQTKAGYLLASGLIGTTRSISLYDIHECLTRNDKFLVMALLIGCAISNKGTSSVHVYKVLSAHLPFLLMPTLCEFKIPSVIQCSALISIGILFVETMNTLLTNQLLNEMSKETFDSEQSSERYAYVLSAGFALGLVNLGMSKGREITDAEIPIANTRFSAKERLLKLLRGGPREQCMVLFDRKVCSPQVSGTSSPVSQESESATCVRELPDANIHLTSPAACAALALMYLRTGDKWISNALTIPNTFCEIERIRPDVLMMRVAAKCLVDYDEIGTSTEWVDQQIPEIVRKYVRHFFNYRNSWWETFVDMDVVAQAYFYCAAGACFAMALRHPSGWDPVARSTILNVYNRLQADDSVGNVYSRLCLKAGKNCVSACINVCAISLGILMAGSGDLHTTRVLRRTRNHVPRLQPTNPSRESSVHSLHSFSNMALGLVYLGHGRYRLGRSNLAIAGLLMAFFPVFPHSLMDNRAYLQVMRFLWTMAVEDQIVPVEEHKATAAVRGVS